MLTFLLVPFQSICFSSNLILMPCVLFPLIYDNVIHTSQSVFHFYSHLCLFKAQFVLSASRPAHLKDCCFSFS